MPRTVFIIVNTATGKPVQTWNYAGKSHIIYCENPEWAMQCDTEAGANDTMDYLKKNFREPRLSVMRVTFTTTVTFG